MDHQQQKATGLEYEFSIYQIEYSRNLLFQRGRQMDTVYQKIIDLTRGQLDIERLKTIFGRKRRPYNHKSTASAPEVRIERPDYNMTIFKIHFGRLTVKLYDKGERTLRAEVVVHNTKELKCRRKLAAFGEIIEKLETIMNNFLSNLEYAHVATIDDGAFEKLAMPAQAGKNRLAGLNFNKERVKQVAAILVILSMKPGGFNSKDLAEAMKSRYNTNYSRRNAAYDLRKFRGKALVRKVNGKMLYEVTNKGLSTITGILSLLTKDIPALISVMESQHKDLHKDQLVEMDKHLFNLQQESEKIKKLRGIQMAA